MVMPEYLCAMVLYLRARLGVTETGSETGSVTLEQVIWAAAISAAAIVAAAVVIASITSHSSKIQ
jgi:hypothetical protein